MSGFLPRPQQPFLDRNGLVDPIWRDYLRSLTPDAASAELQQQVNALGLRVSALESADEAGVGNVMGRNSLVQYGRLADGAVYLELVGDEQAPDPLRYYGTDTAGNRGFHLRLLATLADIDLTDLADGDVLVWDEVEEKWVPGAGGGGGTIQMRVDSGWIEYSNDGGTTWVQLIELSDLQGPPGDEGPAGPPGPSSSCFPTASFDGSTAAVEVGKRCILGIPFGFDITAYRFDSVQTGSIVVDVLVDGVSITALNPAVITASNENVDSTLTGWTTSVASGSRIEFVVLACTGIRQATLVLEGVRV